MNKLFFFLCAILLAACGTKEKAPGLVRISNVRILNDTASALTARIKFSLSQSAGASIVITDLNSGIGKKYAAAENNTEHSIAVFGLKEKTNYEVKIEVAATDNSMSNVSGAIRFTTAAIPASVKEFYKPEENVISDGNNGYLFFTSRYAPACMYLLDNTGKLVWYRISKNMLKVVRKTAKNTLLCLEDENNTSFGDGNVILELNFAGDTLFYVRQGTKGFDKSVHHDLYLNKQGNIVGVTNVYKPGITIPGDGLIEFDRNGNKVWEWTTFDTPDAAATGIEQQPWINSLVQDNDGNYIVSLRSFSQVWKINAVTKSVMWKLGKGGDIQMDAADEFQFQHYAHRNPAGDIMLFDNGSAARPVSRLMSFTLDEQQKKLVRKLNASLPSNLYSMIMGSTMMLPDQHLLTASSTNSKIVKTDNTGQVIWTLKVKEAIYRAEFVTDPFLVK